MTMILGYNSNGFAHHRLDDAVEILHELGYRGLALTVDVHHLDPFHPAWHEQTRAFALRHAERGFSYVIETGARFLLDPRQKHQPTLISAEPDRVRLRRQFLIRCLEIAKILQARIVSLWSGAILPGQEPRQPWQQLVDELRRLSDVAAEQGLRLAFEPEPGMFIDTMEKFSELSERVNHPAFGLTLDVGHLVCQREIPIGVHIRRWRHCLWNVHIDDMRPGVHDHLAFGEGEVDFTELFAALSEIGYAGMVAVELSRHSHDAVATAARSRDFLQRYLPSDHP